MRKGKKLRKIKVCPICKSASLTPYMGFATGIKYKCRKCGYIGPLFLEIEVEENRKSSANSRKN